MTNGEMNSVLLALGKVQVEAMFRRQDIYPIDDSEFLPLLEVVLNAFDTAGIEKAVTEEVWEYAFEGYNQACQEVDPSWTTNENRKLMQGYLLGSRGLKRKR